MSPRVHTMVRRVAATLRTVAQRGGFDVIRYPAGTTWGVNVKRLIDETDCDLVIDVGANVGDWATWLRSLGYGGRIISFEPDPTAAATLKRAAAADPAWAAREEALGDADEHRSLRLSPLSRLSSFLDASELGTSVYSELRDPKLHDVSVHRLDSVLDGESARSIFLKIDTQGWEFHVLRGATEILDAVQGILVEVVVQATYDGSPDYLELLAWLRKHGFHPVDVHVVWVNDAGFIGELDVLLRRWDGSA